jgi:hypothetical protein
MSERSELRAIVSKWAAWCEWPECPLPGAQLAHIEGIGMGGRPSADTLGNVAWLCVPHHDLLDGRSHANLRMEMAKLLGAYLAGGWRRTIEVEASA